MTCYTSRSLKRRSCDLALGSRQPQTLCWCLSRNRISELGRVKVEALGLGLPKKNLRAWHGLLPMSELI